MKSIPFLLLWLSFFSLCSSSWLESRPGIRYDVNVVEKLAYSWVMNTKVSAPVPLKPIVSGPKVVAAMPASHPPAPPPSLAPAATPVSTKGKSVQTETVPPTEDEETDDEVDGSRSRGGSFLDLQRQNAVLKQMNRALETANDAHAEEKQQLEEQLADLTAQLEANRSTLQQPEAALKTTEEEKEKLEVNFMQKIEENANKDAALLDLMDARDLLVQALADEKKQAQTAYEAVETAQRITDAQNGVAQILEKEKKDLDQEKITLGEEQKVFAAQQNQWEERRQAVEKDLSALQETLTDLAQRIVQKQEERETGKRASEMWRKNLLDWKKKLVDSSFNVDPPKGRAPTKGVVQSPSSMSPAEEWRDDWEAVTQNSADTLTALDETLTEEFTNADERHQKLEVLLKQVQQVLDILQRDSAFSSDFSRSPSESDEERDDSCCKEKVEEEWGWDHSADKPLAEKEEEMERENGKLRQQIQLLTTTLERQKKYTDSLVGIVDPNDDKAQPTIQRSPSMPNLSTPKEGLASANLRSSWHGSVSPYQLAFGVSDDEGDTVDASDDDSVACIAATQGTGKQQERMNPNSTTSQDSGMGADKEHDADTASSSPTIEAQIKAKAAEQWAAARKSPETPGDKAPSTASADTPPQAGYPSLSDMNNGPSAEELSDSHAMPPLSEAQPQKAAEAAAEAAMHSSASSCEVPPPSYAEVSHADPWTQDSVRSTDSGLGNEEVPAANSPGSKVQAPIPAPRTSKAQNAQIAHPNRETVV